MEIIPVIDLLGGQVVRAQRGERGNYQPIRSLLCTSSGLLDVAHGLLELYPFPSLYIADLDAIQGLGDNLDDIARLRRQSPHVELWLDAGVRHPQQLEAIQDIGLRCVIGSERLQSLAQYQQLAAMGNDALLSLDFGSAGFMGPGDLLQHAELWPQRLICMTLAKVGSYEGPDLAALSALAQVAGKRQVYAAGGIRSMEDLQSLTRAGVAGALVASALHDGRLGRSQLSAVMP